MSNAAAIVAALAALACAALGRSAVPPRAEPQPVLYVTMDDVGLDLQAAAATPFLDALAQAPGAYVYDRFVAAPVCSNARAKVETGYYSMRPAPLNGVGGNFGLVTNQSLAPAPHLLAARVTGAAQVGKWHLCDHDARTHRGDCGYVSYGGSQANLGPVGGYYSWLGVVNGAWQQVDEYATDWTAARTVAEVSAGRPLVACHFNATHTPDHQPPGMSESGPEAALEYLDGALSWLVPYALRRGYAVVILSDNGGTVANGGKGNLSHQALATFLLCVGFDRPLQPRPVVDCTDVHATIVDAATGSPPTATDGASLLDPSGSRFAAFADKFSGYGSPGDDWQEMATDGVTKVLRVPATGDVVVTDWFDAPSNADPGPLLAALDSR